MIERIRNLDRKKIIAGVILLLVLIALPVTIFSLRNRQNIASQAGNPVTVTLQPTSGNINLNQTLDVQVILKAGAISVQTAEFSVSYGQIGQPNIVTAQFIPNASSGFTALYDPPVEINESTKTLIYKTAVNVGTNNITGDIVLGTLKLTGVSTGTAQVNFTGGAFNELSGELTPTFINGSYTVGNAQPPTQPTGNPSDPIIETLPQTGSTPTMIMFNSRVNPNGNSVRIKYMYTTTNTTCQNMGTGRVQTIGPLTGTEYIEPNSVSAGSLSPNTTYYYCAIATVGNTPYYGNVVTFTAPPVPTATPVPMVATTTTATGIQQNQATLRGTVNARNNVASVYYRYSTTNGSCESLSSTTTAETFAASASNRTVNQTATGLQANTTYYYCVVIESSTTTPSIVRGAVVSFKTLASTTVSQPVATNTSIPVTNSPVPSPNSNQAIIALDLKLPGIGNNNNGQNLNLGENNSPRTQRTFDILLYNSEAQQVGNPINTQFTYSPTDGAYKGSVLLSGIPFNTAYEIKVKTDNSLIKRLGFIENLAPGQTYPINANNPNNEIITGKVNLTSPNLIGLQDYNDFMKCFRNQSTCTPAMKARADFTDDGKIDLKDLNILLSAFANRQGD